MVKINKKWFTFVELIVVSTILAILWAVWFVAYTGYISWARDANRITQLADITDGLNILTAQSALPLPEKSVDVIIWWETIAHQWYAGQSILDSIWFQQWGKDPKDGSFFTYYLDKKRSNFQLMAFLEEEWATSFFNNEAYANDYSTRIPTVYGQKMWVLTDEFNTPIQEIDSIKSAGNLNITSSTTWYISHISETEQFTWSDLVSINPNLSCKRIKDLKKSSKDGRYQINPDGNGSFSVLCDMETDGWGWTVIEYTDDLEFLNHFIGSNARRWLSNDFTFNLTVSQIEAIQANSTEWRQKFVFDCRWVVIHEFNGSYTLWAAFEYFNGEESPKEINFNANPQYNISVSEDDCEINNGNVTTKTIFQINDPRVPVTNIETEDPWATSEFFGSPLTNNPAYLR